VEADFLIPENFDAARKLFIKSLKYLLFLSVSEENLQQVQGGRKPTSGRPLVIFLHGASARGDSTIDLKSTGLPGLLTTKSVPFLRISDWLIVSPLCPKGVEWKSAEICEVVIALIDFLISAPFNVDSSRIYLTGISMGGLGTWMMAARYPRFSAAVPICGGGNSVFALKLRDFPMWY